MIPAGTPPWAVEAFTQLADKITILLNRTSRERTTALDHNRLTSMCEHDLLPVPHPDTGLMPPAADFPATVGVLRGMNSDAINTLLKFYGLPRTGDRLDRLHRLATAIGFSHA